jgi:predicted nucleic acid-binding protein
MTSLDACIAAGARLVLDGSVLIAYLAAAETVSPVARVIIEDYLGGERNDAVLSALAAGEILVRPHREGTARSVAFEILDMPGLTIRSVDFLVAAEAARMCAVSSLRLPDAIMLATGILAGATYLVTNDRRLAAAASDVAPGMAVCLLADHVGSADIRPSA